MQLKLLSASEAHVKSDEAASFNPTAEQLQNAVNVLAMPYVMKAGVEVLEAVATLVLAAVVKGEKKIEYHRHLSSDLDVLLMTHMKKHLEQDYGYKVTLDYEVLNCANITVEF